MLGAEWTHQFEASHLYGSAIQLQLLEHHKFDTDTRVSGTYWLRNYDDTKAGFKHVAPVP